MIEFINGLPKAELHLHIEGTLEPELMFKLARRNKIKINYDSVDELKQAYNFGNLQDFLDIYYAGTAVLIREEDFYDMTYAYLQKASSQNVLHCELFFDPQTHTQRGIKFETVIRGMNKAIIDAEKQFGISVKLIMCFLRHLDENSAIKTLEEALPHKDKIIGIGLDSAEVGNPPSKFVNIFKKAEEYGFLKVAHAGEEGPSEYVWEALNYLQVSRIDHGNRSMDDHHLVSELARTKIPLTVCPLSNLKLKVVNDMRKHPLRSMLDNNLMVTINSDDPAYFGGYVNENYLAVTEALDLTPEEITKLAKNSFEASFISDDQKKLYSKKIDDHLERYLKGI